MRQRSGVVLCKLDPFIMFSPHSRALTIKQGDGYFFLGALAPLVLGLAFTSATAGAGTAFPCQRFVKPYHHGLKTHTGAGAGGALAAPLAPAAGVAIVPARASSSLASRKT